MTMPEHLRRCATCSQRRIDHIIGATDGETCDDFTPATTGPTQEAMYCLDEARDALRRGNAYAAQEAMMKGAEWAQVILDREGCKRFGTLS